MGGRTLTDLARGEIELSHDALDALDRGKSTEHLRAALVHAGALSVRDEPLAKLEDWTNRQLSAIAPGPDQTTLRAFATWKIGRELAARRRRDPRPDPLAATMPKHWITAAIQLSGWLHHKGLTPAELDQQRLDDWLAGEPPRRRRDARRFVAWLERHHARRGLRVPAPATSTAVVGLADHERLAALRTLLADDTVDPRLRVAGCLVALYAQPVARIVRLTAADLQLTDAAAFVRLGDEPVPLPQPLRRAAASLLQDAASDTPWLFPGLKAGQPANPAHLARRLRHLGVPSLPARSSALGALAHRIPAPVLAELLGLSAQTVANASAQLRVDHAAYVARRT